MSGSLGDAIARNVEPKAFRAGPDQTRCGAKAGVGFVKIESDAATYRSEISNHTDTSRQDLNFARSNAPGGE